MKDKSEIWVVEKNYDAVVKMQEFEISMLAASNGSQKNVSFLFVVIIIFFFSSSSYYNYYSFC